MVVVPGFLLQGRIAMTVFTYEKVKALMDAADALLTNLSDAGGWGPEDCCIDDSYPLDTDGKPVFQDNWDLHCAWKALTEEDS